MVVRSFKPRPGARRAHPFAVINMSISQVVIRNIKTGEEQQVCNLIELVFEEFIAPLYEEDGVEEFLRYIDPSKMVSRLENNHFVLVSELDGELLGAIEVRNYNHISLLFVVSNEQRQGLAKRLLYEAHEICKDNIGFSEMSVNSSPNAVEAYGKLGFEVDDQEQLKNGIRYIPMRLRINPDNDS